METSYSLADIAAATGNNNNCGGGFGGDWAAWIVLFLIFGLFGDGFGGFGGFGGRNAGNSPAIQGLATRADINEGFALNDIQNGIRGIQQGICDSTYALSNIIQSGDNATQMALMNGFNTANVTALQNSNALQTQIANCCCENKEGQAQIRYDMATNTCNVLNAMNSNTRDIIQSQEAGTRAVLDYLCNEKISSLQSENQSLKLAASQANQNVALGAMMEANTAEILRRTAPLPVPAYTVPAPYPYGYNGGCGCNCGNGYGVA